MQIKTVCICNVLCSLYQVSIIIALLHAACCSSVSCLFFNSIFSRSPILVTSRRRISLCWLSSNVRHVPIGLFFFFFFFPSLSVKERKRKKKIDSDEFKCRISSTVCFVHTGSLHRIFQFPRALVACWFYFHSKHDRFLSREAEIM